LLCWCWSFWQDHQQRLALLMLHTQKKKKLAWVQCWWAGLCLRLSMK
jgi:hypothetical protein